MQVLKELFASKKFVASLVGVITAIAVKFGASETSITELLTLVSPILVYVGAQGFADMGKEAAAIKAEGSRGGDA